MKKTIFFITISIFLTGSCSKDFLERSPISNMNEQDFYQTESDFNTAIMAVYRTLHTIYGPSGPVSYYGELMSDNATLYAHNGTIGEYLNINAHAVKEDNALINGFWENFYQSLFRVNTFIEKVQASSIASKDQYEGEARFLRGLYYSLMVQMWGDVPLVTKPLNVDESYAQGRTPVAQVYEQVIEDLKFAADKLPAKPSVAEKGRICKEAAYGILAKVYLARNASGDKALAETALRNIYQKAGFALVNYADLWDMTKKNGAESVFEIQYKGGSGNPYSSYWRMFTPHENHDGVFLNGPFVGQLLHAAGGGDNQVTVDLWNAYEPNDPRRDLSIVNGWKTSTGEEFPNHRFPGKWIDLDAPRVGEVEMCDNNFIVLRYADILLLLSEVTGDAQYLNEVRRRANLPEWGNAAYPIALYPTLDEAIAHERHVELALEFHRYFDLKRTGKAQAVLGASDKAIAKVQLVWPIPLKVITQNPEVILQNP
ncbi:MAG: RagB/SusD family nutrient uptake outer membrane protein [Bacteroidales bacterium]|nr:RagB/SusD family nutrient uptake outer membrane protein [Bacteroidales bacterium]